ncbi:MAG: hypothetical protein AAGU74_00115 [Bacillota bacterium]
MQNTKLEWNETMNDTVKQIALQAMEQGGGILRLAPSWVPRAFCRPGRRLKLYPNEYYACGLDRGGIDERWIASTTSAANGPCAPEEEGQSRVVTNGGSAALLRDVIAELKEEAVGDLWPRHGGWPVFAKFFDNYDALAHHIHHRQAHALRVNQNTKPEMYFFPAQMNNYTGELPITFFGLNPEVTLQDVKARLEAFHKGDNDILSLSRAYKLELDTGWNVPPGLLHAPGSLCTYEPQFASDISCVFQSVLHRDRTVDASSLWMNCPDEEIGNYDYLLSLIDFEVNTDPDFHKKYFMRPKPVLPPAEMLAEGYLDEWICYKNAASSAKRLTVLPGRSVTLADGVPSGLICIQGHGRVGSLPVESPTLIHYDQWTNDEFFITQKAAADGFEVKNLSETEDLVLLRNFADHPALR